jgi:hypothetical protein
VEVPAPLIPVLGAIGGAIALLVRTGAKWVRYRMLRSRVRGEARADPVFGSVGWLYNELRKESSARHVLEKTVGVMRERIAHLEGRRASESGEREVGPNDTDPVDPPFAWDDEPRTPAEGAIVRSRRRGSRP